MLQRIEGFDHETVALLAAKGGITSANIDSLVTGRDTGRALEIGALRSIYFSVTGNPSTLIVGKASKFDGTVTVFPFAFREGTTKHVVVAVNLALGKVLVYRDSTLLAETAEGLITTGSWVYLEAKVVIHDSAGSVSIRKDGVEILSVSSVDTMNGGTGVITNFGVYNQEFSGSELIDDLYIADTTGAVNNDFLGDVRVVTLRPDGAGDSTQFTPSAGANYECVDDDQVDSDTTYVESSTVGQKDLYALGALGLTPSSIFAVQVSAYARKDDSGVRTARVITKSGTTTENGDETTLGTTYTGVMDLMELNPDDSAAWELADINALQAGIEVVS